MKSLLKTAKTLKVKFLLLFLSVYAEVFAAKAGNKTKTYIESIYDWAIPIIAIYVNFLIIKAIVKVVKKLTDDVEDGAKSAAYKQLYLLGFAILLINGFWYVMSDWGMSLGDALFQQD